MRPTDIISKKKNGGEHSPEELSFFLNSFLQGSVTDYQMAAWLMAVCFKGMTVNETLEWTQLMWKSGTTFERSHRNDFWVDKHSTGGVGDKPSLLLVPIVAAVTERLFGKGKVKLPMVSGRGLGHTGGTLDKLESVGGFSSKIKLSDALKLLQKNGFFMIGQTEEIAPADRRIYALRDVTSTVDSIPLIVSSIMSKKLSENLDGLLFDVKVGSGAFMKDREQALALARALVSVAKANRIDAVAHLTRMDEPIGRNVGNFLEIEECWDFLHGNQEPGLKELILEMAAEMVFLSSRRQIPIETCRKECAEELSSSRARAHFQNMFESQGGQWDEFTKNFKRPPIGYKKVLITASQAGYLSQCEALKVGLLLNQIGGGRNGVTDSIDPWVGFVFEKKVGDRIEKGDTLVTCILRDSLSEKTVKDAFESILLVNDRKPRVDPFLLEKVA
ncbi:MAG: thymidine phosphorylase [Proteobacteria bacterium]|nr:thymidine phosphorylase [Pseudomonadota bacterium]NDC24114.1 thymidine phosphorylase [Pseudomonadota bacterium]NDD04145.1 thymidine phosphorylase [Pseudomonadota bacterium]NDG26363.1 thymidine phosphorylase [Pseudomonadota bacterium]